VWEFKPQTPHTKSKKSKIVPNSGIRKPYTTHPNKETDFSKLTLIACKQQLSNNNLRQFALLRFKNKTRAKHIQKIKTKRLLKMG